jgi:hypothetical protein
VPVSKKKHAHRHDTGKFLFPSPEPIPGELPVCRYSFIKLKYIETALNIRAETYKLENYTGTPATPAITLLSYLLKIERQGRRHREQTTRDNNPHLLPYLNGLSPTLLTHHNRRSLK